LVKLAVNFISYFDFSYSSLAYLLAAMFSCLMQDRTKSATIPYRDRLQIQKVTLDERLQA
jgi:hypothetical protein